jgi:hypothetical protein
MASHASPQRPLNPKAGKRGFYKGEMKMQKEDLKGAHVGRAGFLKVMIMA